MDKLSKGQRSQQFLFSLITGGVGEGVLTCIRLRIWKPIQVPGALVDVQSVYLSSCQSLCDVCDYVEAGGCSSYRDPPLPSNPLILSLPKLSLQIQREEGEDEGERRKRWRECMMKW